jgi:hypothetical protein
MKIDNLTKLIKGKWFDDYQSGLSSRFSASGMSYSYHYEENGSINSVVVLLGKEDVKTKIELSDNGNLNFHYSDEIKGNIEEFENCTDEDFHTMLAHAFIYIRDGNFDYHKEWHSNLKRKN